MKNKYLITIKDDEKFLRQISKKVNLKTDKNLENDIKILDEFCKENEVMAMAAVQLGIPKRLIYLKNTDLNLINKIQDDSITEEERQHNEAKILVNPVIIKKEGLTEYWESCASCINNCGLVRRPYKILVRYSDLDGKKHQKTFKGFESTVLCHEIDHLDGILHIDIAIKLLKLEKEERKKLRLKHNYTIFEKTGDYIKLAKFHK